MSNSPYQTGLGPQALRRIRIVFILSVLLFFAVSGSMVYAGVKTGEIERRFIAPVRTLIAEVGKALEESENATSTDYSDSNTNSSTGIRVEINNSYTATSSTTIRVTPATQFYKQYNITPVPTIDYQKQYDANQQAIDDWWAQVQAENKAKSAESQKQLEEFKQQSQQNLQNFSDLGEKCAQEFSENHGEYTSQECKDFWNK